MVVVITNVAGLPGRNLVFEFIKQNISNLKNIKIHVLNREHDFFSVDRRFNDILFNNGIYYIDVENENIDYFFYLVNNNDISYITYVSLILDELNKFRYKFVDKEPNDKNEAEQFYYKTIGKLFTPYLLMDHYDFNYKNIFDLQNNISLFSQVINVVIFKKLILHARKNNFEL